MRAASHCSPGTPLPVTAQVACRRTSAFGRTGSGRVRAAVAVVALALPAAALSGCAAGKQAQTAHVAPTIDGIDANIGAMALRNIGITAPPATGYTAKGSAPLTLAISNEGDQADELVSVTTSAAASVKVTPPAAAGTAAPSSTASTVPGRPAAIPVPPQGIVQIGSGQGTATITLSGLTAPLVSGQNVAVTFAFRTAGTKTVVLPVRLRADNTGGETVSVGSTGN